MVITIETYIQEVSYGYTSNPRIIFPTIIITAFLSIARQSQAVAGNATSPGSAADARERPGAKPRRGCFVFFNLIGYLSITVYIYIILYGSDWFNGYPLPFTTEKEQFLTVSVGPLAISPILSTYLCQNPTEPSWFVRGISAIPHPTCLLLQTVPHLLALKTSQRDHRSDPSVVAWWHFSQDFWAAVVTWAWRRLADAWKEEPWKATVWSFLAGGKTKPTSQRFWKVIYIYLYV